jgi:hypothetical protein
MKIPPNENLPTSQKVFLGCILILTVPFGEFIKHQMASENREYEDTTFSLTRLKK